MNFRDAAIAFFAPKMGTVITEETVKGVLDLIEQFDHPIKKAPLDLSSPPICPKCGRVEGSCGTHGKTMTA